MVILASATLFMSLAKGTAQEFQFGLFSYELVGANAVITDYPTNATGTVIVPSTIAAFPVTSIGNSAFEFCRDITSVVMRPNVTSIGLEAFRGCHSLTLVAIPESVSSIGSSAFEDCRSMASVALPRIISFLGSEVFSGCDALESVVFTGSVPFSTPSDTFLDSPADLVVYHLPSFAWGFNPSPWTGIEPMALVHAEPPPILAIEYRAEGRLVGIPPRFVPIVAVGIGPVYGETVGVEYSPDMSEGSWIDVGDFAPNSFYPAGTWTYVDFDLIRPQRPTGYYRAFLRTLGE